MRIYVSVRAISPRFSRLFRLHEICQEKQPFVEFSKCFTTCLVSQCSAWKRELSFACSLSYSALFNTYKLIKMFAVQQTFATKTVQVNKVNKTTKASFVQDMKKVNKYAPFVLFLRLNLGAIEPRQFSSSYVDISLGK